MSRDLAHIPATESVHSFLDGLFDYAGLFPPASLALADAMELYARHRRGPDRWMIGPFVCPVSMITNLETFGELFSIDPPFLFSMLGSRATGSADLSERFEADLDAILEFQNRYPGRVRVDMMEIRVSTNMIQSASELDSILDRMESKLGSSGLSLETVFLEVVRDARFVEALDLVVDVLAERVRMDGSSAFGLKLRCGGMEPLLFPSTADIASFLARVIPNHLLFKTTAGLHHPVRHWSCLFNVHMHGFLNVFFAAVLLEVHALSEADLVPILEEKTAGAFVFTDEGIWWRHLSASLADLRGVRQNQAASIGSCSFSEPLDDLRSLNWLRFADSIQPMAT